MQPAPGMFIAQQLAPAGHAGFPTSVPIPCIILQAPTRPTVSLERRREHESTRGRWCLSWGSNQTCESQPRVFFNLMKKNKRGKRKKAITFPTINCFNGMFIGLNTFMVKRLRTLGETMNWPRTKIVGLLPVSFGANPVLAFRYLVSAKDVMSSWRLDCHLAPSHTLREELLGHYWWWAGKGWAWHES